MTQVADKQPTKIRILETSKEMMLEKGYTATSIDDICKCTGVAKGSFFHYFKNKEELGKSLIQYFSEQMKVKFESMMSPIAKDPLQRIYAFLDCVKQMANSPEAKGCLVGTLAAEIHQTHPELKQACSESMCGTLSSLRADFEAAKAQYVPKSTVDTSSLAELCSSVMQGSFVLYKATGNNKMLKSNVEHLTNYIKSIYEK
ncbi:MAG: TetR/AcrR family transcriptional repressor of nem operon [Candidatus Omnitrophota bacterium]|jgi:TetR/AcrR family transcriptional repressor of nem operon